MCAYFMNLSLHQVKVAVRVAGLDVTKGTVQMEAALEAEVVAAMTVADMTAVVDMTVADMTVADTTVAEEVDLLVWGKLHSATAPKVPHYTEMRHDLLSLTPSSLVNHRPST